MIIICYFHAVCAPDGSLRMMTTLLTDRGVGNMYIISTLGVSKSGAGKKQRFSRHHVSKLIPKIIWLAVEFQHLETFMVEVV